MDVNIEHAVMRTEVVVSLEVRPHRAVRLVMKPLGANQLVTVMRKPREFPRERPTGCARRPAVPHRPGEMGGKSGADARGVLGNLEGRWKGVAACVEMELCGICDKMAEGRPDARYTGRAEGARLVQEQSLPQRGAGAKGRLDVITYGYTWTETRVRELIWLGKKASKEGIQWPAAARAQWHGLIGRFMRPGQLLKSIMKEDPTFAECVAFMSGPDVCYHFEEMEAWADWLRSKVETKRKTRMERARSAWRAFIKDSQRKGAKELHAFVKRQETVQGESVGSGIQRTGSPQAIVDAERQAWAKIWDHFKGTCGAPWRGADLPGEE